MDRLHVLNPAQREAVLTLSGPLLVLAGAGTGKTRVITYRMAELIRRGTDPQRILSVTFTNKAAREMQERTAALLGGGSPRKRGGDKRPSPVISTFHSYCVRVLRQEITRLGYPAQFAIYDRGDQESVARQALREIRAPDTLLRPGDLLFHIGRWKTHSVLPDRAGTLATNDREHLAAVAYRRYQNALKQAGAVDFDDLLLCTEQLFTRFAEVRAAEAGRFSHLLIDEYQEEGQELDAATDAALREHGEPWRIGQAFLDEWCRGAPCRPHARYAGIATLRAFAWFGIGAVPALLLVQVYALFLNDAGSSGLLPRLVLLCVLAPIVGGALTGITVPVRPVRATRSALALLITASAVGGIPEVVADGETGLLVPIEQVADGTGTPVDPDRFVAALSAAMTELIEDPERARRMGLAGRQRAVERFSWSRIAADTMAVYRSVL